MIKPLLIAIAACTAIWATSSPAAPKSTPKTAWPSTPKLPATPVLPAAASSAPTPLRTMYGGREHVTIGDSPTIQITADLNADAKQALIFATGISYFFRDGDLWVSFVIDSGSVMAGNRTTLKRKVLKDQHIRERGGGVGHEPIVAVDICIGNVALPIQATVKPRTGYLSPLRLGKPEIERLGGVDPVLKFTAPPECVVAKPEQAGAAAN